MSTCDVFNRLFPLDVQNEIQLLSGVFCYSWLVFLLGFWLKNTSRFWMASFSFLPRLMRKRVAKSAAILALIPFRAASRMASLANYCISCLFVFFFISNLMKSSVVYGAI